MIDSDNIGDRHQGENWGRINENVDDDHVDDHNVQDNQCLTMFYSSTATEYAKTTEQTTRRPQTFTSVLEGQATGCHHNGKFYEDGAQVPSDDRCKHCYCMRDEVVCAIQDCPLPCDGCIPIYTDNDTCCPEKFECCEF